MPPPMTSGLSWFQRRRGNGDAGAEVVGDVVLEETEEPAGRSGPAGGVRPGRRRLPRPCGSRGEREARSSRAVSMAPALTTTSLRARARARQATRPASSIRIDTPVTRPLPSVVIRSSDREGDELAAAGREGAGEHGVLGAVLAVARAGKADAGAALDAGGAPGARHGVDQERRGQGRDAPSASAPRAGARAGGAARHRRHRVVARARPDRGRARAVAGDADLPFGALVPGRRSPRRRSASR